MSRAEEVSVIFNFSKFNRKHYYLVGAVSTGLVAVLVFASSQNKPASALELGNADNFAILAGSTITSTGATTVNGDIGLHPGTSITQTPDIVLTGTIHLTDAVALAAKDSLVTSYNTAAAAATTESISADLGGRTLVGGVYTSGSSLGLTGALILDAQGDPNSEWIFQAGSTLTTSSASSVVLINGGDPCNVFWQVGSSATLGSNSTLIGTVMALTSISANSGATIEGRLLAQNGAVTLIANTISRPICLAATATPTVSPTVTPTDTATPTPNVTPTDTATPTPTPSGGVTSLATPSPTVTPAPTTTANPVPTSSGTPTSTPSPTPSSQVSNKPTGSVGTGN